MRRVCSSVHVEIGLFQAPLPMNNCVWSLTADVFTFHFAFNQKLRLLSENIMLNGTITIKTVVHCKIELSIKATKKEKTLQRKNKKRTPRLQKNIIQT